jgi:hypothetical protein
MAERRPRLTNVDLKVIGESRRHRVDLLRISFGLVTFFSLLGYQVWRLERNPNCEESTAAWALAGATLIILAGYEIGRVIASYLKPTSKS